MNGGNTNEINIDDIAKSIIGEHDKYKEAIYLKNNQKKYEELSEEKKKEVDKRFSKYENFVNGLENLIKSEGLTKSVVTNFVKSNGYAQAIASTITFNRTQLRKLFNQIRRIEMEVKRERNISKVEVKLAKMHAILAYAKGRKLIDGYFYSLMNVMINKVMESKDEDTFRNFIDIFESIVAYHVYYNPSNQ